MGLYFGNKQIDIYWGNKPIDKIYKGNSLKWQKYHAPYTVLLNSCSNTTNSTWNNLSTSSLKFTYNSSGLTLSTTTSPKTMKNSTYTYGGKINWASQESYKFKYADVTISPLVICSSSKGSLIQSMKLNNTSITPVSQYKSSQITNILLNNTNELSITITVKGTSGNTSVSSFNLNTIVESIVLHN